MITNSKKTIVLGAGKSGIAASKLLIRHDIDVLLFDNNPKICIDGIRKVIFGRAKFNVKLEDVTDDDLKDVELCVISPGFPKTNVLYKKILAKGIMIISELELAYLYTNKPIAAVTGSNGKTTVTGLIGEIFKLHYKGNAAAVGNIGKVYSDEVLKNPDGNYVCECSSFQLEDIVSFKPKVATILNFSPDHLDRYGSYADYINAKLNIAINMKKDETLILNYEDPILRDLVQKKRMFACRIVFFSSKRTLSEGFYISDDAIYFKENNKIIKLIKLDELKIIGMHNYENAMAGVAVAYYMGIPLSTCVNACKDFKGFPHRIEFIREKNGVKYYNDSKGTNPDAAIKAIDAMKGKTLLIAGGHDKGIDYGDFILKCKEKVRYIILIGEAKKKIALKARDLGFNSVVYADSLEEAVDIANSYSNVGENVLLSPACSSYDMFKNYEERGDRFREKVLSL